MAYPIRHLDPNTTYFITSRTIQSRFLLAPTAKTNELLGGILARAVRLSGVELFAYVFTSNHYPFNLVNRIQSATVLVPQRLADLALPCRWSASASRKAVIASARGAACPETLPAPAPAPDLERTPWARGRRHAASKTREREKPAAFAGSPRSSHGPKAPLCPRTTDAPPRRTSGI
jgi:hypothetical protein